MDKVTILKRKNPLVDELIELCQRIDNIGLQRVIGYAMVMADQRPIRDAKIIQFPKK